MNEEEEKTKKKQIAKAEQYEGQAQQWAEIFDNHNNRMERITQDKHIMRIGAMSIELSPDGNTSIPQVMKEFKIMVEHLHKLHGDEHLKMMFKNEGDGMPPESMNGGLYN